MMFDLFTLALFAIIAGNVTARIVDAVREAR
jgi:hypothetical protein